MGPKPWGGFWAGLNVFVPETECNGPNWGKGASGSLGTWQWSWAGSRHELMLAQVQPLGKEGPAVLPLGLAFR